MKKIISSCIASFMLLMSAFAVMPEVQKLPVWPEGKMPNAQTHQAKPWYRWLEPTNRTSDVIFIITNGGGYHGGAPGGTETRELVAYLLAKGVTVVEFKYRTPRPKGLEKHVSAWQDAQRVIRIVRHEAKRRGWDSERIGFCGFSAGGHLTIMTAVSSQTAAYEPIGDDIDKEPCHVNFAVPVYPAYGLEAGADSPEDKKTMALDMPLVPEFKFDGKTAPMCFLHGANDDWTPMTSVRCWHRERAMRLPAELHVMAMEYHCFQFRPVPGTPAAFWCDRIWQWLVKLDFVTKHPCEWSGATCPVNTREWNYITPGNIENFADFEPKSWIIDGMCGAWIPTKNGADFTVRRPAAGDYAIDFEFQLYGDGSGVVALGDVELVLPAGSYPPAVVNRCTVYKKDGRPYGFINSKPIPAEFFRPLGEKSVGDRLVFRGLRTKANGYCKYHKARLRDALYELPGDVRIPSRFADIATYASAGVDRIFDVGTTADRPSQRVVSNRGDPRFLIKTVPCQMFTRCWTLCAAEENPAKERAFTVRITRWCDEPERNYTGRSKYAMATHLVNLDAAKKERVGEVKVNGRSVPLWLVETPLDLGDIQDVVNTDQHGNYLRNLGRYLDFEICGPLLTRVSGLNDRTMNTDPERVSAIRVYGAWLERPAAEFAMNWIRPGNVFHNDETPETKVKVKVNRPGSYVLSWDVADAGGRVLKTERRPFSAGGEWTIGLSMPELGWYALNWRLADASDRTLMTHHAAFALLGRDTRTAGQGEGPYSTWESYLAHYMTPEKEFHNNCELMLKAGIRHTGRHPYFPRPMKDLAFRAKYKLSGSNLIGHLENDIVPVLEGKKTEEELAGEYRKRMESDPTCTHCQLFWESAQKPYMQAPELTGGVHNPTNCIPDNGKYPRIQLAKAACSFMHRHFPELPVTIGNSLACTELIAEMIRGGLPEDEVAYMGLEHVGRANLPERLNNCSIQSADLFRELAQRMGRPSWKPGLGIECNFRRDTFLGQDLQAAYYVRDGLLSQCWRFPLINLGGVCDAGNHYVETAWGCDGLCQRWPYLYPKKAYVGYATLTRALDMVTGAEPMDTGDDCVYAVAFPRRDGKCAYAFWTSYGRAELELDTAGTFEAFDFYGRQLQMAKNGSKCRLSASGESAYIVGAPGCIRKATCIKTSFSDKVPADYRVIVRLDDASKWRMPEGPTPDVETGLGSGVPCRVRAKAACFREVDDEIGRCLELDLGEMDLSLPKPVMEYMTLELKEPIPLAGDPQSLGARVKGNSGWGRLYWILEGADGRRTVSSGHRGWVDDYDEGGKMSLGFTGWRFLSYPVDEHSSIVDYAINLVEDLWAEKVTYPAKLVGVAFAAESRPLFLTERRRKRQAIRISEIGFFDNKKDNQREWNRQ